MRIATMYFRGATAEIKVGGFIEGSDEYNIACGRVRIRQPKRKRGAAMGGKRGGKPNSARPELDAPRFF